MFYNPTLFDYEGVTVNVDEASSTVTLDENTAVISGKLRANAGTTSGNEFEDGTKIVTYEFTAKSQTEDKTGTFEIISAYANNYDYAGAGDSQEANKENATVEIVLVDNTPEEGGDEGTVTVPAGTFEAATKVYNAEKQTGNAFEVADGFENAKVTYFAKEGGKALGEDEKIEDQSFKTTLPSWQNVGTYTYYARIHGDGLKTTYVSTTLTITPAELTPSAKFKVDPTFKEVEFTPTLEGALDGTHTGTVTVKYTDKNGDVQTLEFDAADFKHDGETTSKLVDENEKAKTIKVEAEASGKFSVTLTYTEGEADNYTGTENIVSVDNDKVTVTDETAEALERAITSVFGYDATEHFVTVDSDKVAEVTEGSWTYTVSDEDASVKNVGDDKLVKVTFTDTNKQYNNVLVYVILKVNPANVKITVGNGEKVMNEPDPDPIATGTVEVVDEDGALVTGVKFNSNGLYGDDNLEVTYEREIGEEVGKYKITASYAPNDNYVVTVTDGEFEIKAPSTDDGDEENPAKVKIEVVDLSYDNDGTPDYTAEKRLILLYTDIDRIFYGYSKTQSADDAEKLFDVTDAGYKYEKHSFDEDGNLSVEKDETEYKHVYGIVVDKITNEKTGAELEELYKNNIVFLSSSLTDRPTDIDYDGDINISDTIDVNDYSMANGIYNNLYDRETYIKSILKADINHDKKVDTEDVAEVKAIYEAKRK